MKFEIKSRWTGSVLFSLETESLKLCVEAAVKTKTYLRGADLRGADLQGAYLRGADLQGAYLRGADLQGAYLRGADLQGADLQGADLQGADLAYASTDKTYIQISCIGSAKRMTTYCVEDDKVWCGCFTGTMAEFEQQIEKSHKDSPRYLAEYRAAVAFFKACAAAGGVKCG
jgi:hypothetical protein